MNVGTYLENTLDNGERVAGAWGNQRQPCLLKAHRNGRTKEEAQCSSGDLT